MGHNLPLPSDKASHCSHIAGAIVQHVINHWQKF